ncbi:endo-1,4-beta-xylanase [Segatella copri]|uniref:endo-1,4-beta-xylanase n=1 Tax=Segatella copri TaxID=165179 RepID=UPI00294B792F|nr:endo-1,4-beta-xylanase [Segatella copri]WOF87929.1 endo-1,4-beta-xylanase [Segatella copri]WOF94057.1 endo-1,4-beta-xylanase [Segatella copri]
MMKINKIMIPVVASAMLLTGCDDQIMQWGKPADHADVTKAEIPLAVKEVIANYDNIKDYAQQYTPNMKIGIGMGADLYANNENGEGDLANANYQVFTPGNAMKNDAIMGNSGSLNFATVDKLLAALDGNMQLYGHNFFWHTQQNQTYLKSLIAPTLVVESDGDVANVLSGDATDFNGGSTGGWGSWGSNKKDAGVVAGAGQDGTAALVLENKGDGNAWEAQCAYDFNDFLEMNKTYVIKFKAKSSSPAGELQFQYQNGSTYSSQGGYNNFTVGTDWQTFQYEFTITKYDDVNRIILNFGKVGGTYTIDDIQFGLKQEDPMDNVLAGDASDFEGGTTGSWGSWGSNKESAEVEDGAGYNNSKGLALKNKGDGNAWEAQCAYTFDDALQAGKKYIIQFYAKSTSAAGELQFQYQNGSTYSSQGGYNTFSVGTDWVKCEFTFTPAYDDANRIILNFGKVGATYYIDNIKFGLAKDQTSATRGIQYVLARNGKARKATRAGSKMYYILKTPAEKQAALEGAMEAWVSGVANHLKEKNVVPFGYEVINEPIADGSNMYRGLSEGTFGGTWTDDDGNTQYDAAPTEDDANGLTLNWGSGHWYWGYYVPDYHVKAFQLARKYLPADTKLFVNDYNLETSPKKLEALIKFAKEIDEKNGSPIVDGIGTQMHVTLNCSDDAEKNAASIAELKTKVDAMFQTMAATGKLVRVTELDLSLGTGTPSSNQYKAQSDAYRMIVESYKANVPEAQQSGITVWSLSDNEAEHEYWLKGQVPNLFDKDYKRKWAYKGFCDGIAGEDLGLKYGGEEYKAFYEKNNVSSTVDK